VKRTHYRAPSRVRLMEELHIDSATANTVRGLIRGEISTRDAGRFPRSNRHFAWCYHSPSRVDRILRCLDELLEASGVEAIWGKDELRPDADYLNMGDPYIATLVLDRKTNTFKLTSYGDFMETRDRK